MQANKEVESSGAGNTNRKMKKQNYDNIHKKSAPGSVLLETKWEVLEDILDKKCKECSNRKILQ